VHWVHVHPQGGGKKMGGANLQGKVVSAPQAEQESNFEEIGKIWAVAGGERLFRQFEHVF